MKILGGGELSTALFVVADAFTASARAKIEAAGGTVSVLEVPDARRPALGVDDDHADHDDAVAESTEAPAEASAAAEPAAESAAADDEKPKARKPKAAKTDDAEADA
jgi:hypothetical protein